MHKKQEIITPEGPALLTSVSSLAEAGMLSELLKQAGIEHFVKGQGVGGMILGSALPTGFKVYVAGARLEEARALCASFTDGAWEAEENPPEEAE